MKALLALLLLIATPAFSEPALFRLAFAAEQALPARKNPQATPALTRNGQR